MISNLDQRVFFYNSVGGAFTDHTMALNDPSNNKSVSFSMAGGDYIYLSSWLPFNHKYFKIKTAAANARAAAIEFADQGTWSPVVNILDYTESMTVSGALQFTRDRDKSWGKANKNTTDIPALAGAPLVYDSYWLRIGFPGGGSNMAFTLDFIGQCFSNDTDLFENYPMLASAQLRAAWPGGKTDWSDQHIQAANYLAMTLRAKRLIYTNDQILDTSIMRAPAVHKTAHIIYSGLGAANYEKEIHAAAANLKTALDMDQFQVDKDKDGLKGSYDRTSTVSRATR